MVNASSALARFSVDDLVDAASPLVARLAAASVLDSRSGSAMALAEATVLCQSKSDCCILLEVVRSRWSAEQPAPAYFRLSILAVMGRLDSAFSSRRKSDRGWAAAEHS